MDATAALLDGLVDGTSGVSVDALLDRAGRAASAAARGRLRESYHRVRDRVDTLRRRHDQLRDVHEATGELVAIRNVDVVLKAITSRARRLLRCDYVYLSTPDPGDEGAFAIRAWSGDLTPRFRGIRVSPGHGVGGIVLQTGEPFQVDDYSASTDFAHEADFDAILAQQGITTLLGAPLTVSGTTVGLLFAARRDPRRFSDDDIFLLTSLATHAAIALQNAELDESGERARDDLSQAVADSEGKRRAAARDARMHVELSSIVLGGGGVADILDAVRAELGFALAYVDRTSATGALTVSGELGQVPGTEFLDVPGGSTPSPALRSIRVGTQRWAIVDVASVGGLLGHLVSRGAAVPDRGVASMLERAGQAVALSQLSTQALAAADRRTAEELVTKIVQSPQRMTDELARRAQRNGIDRTGPTMVLADTADPVAAQIAVEWTAGNGGLAAVLDDILVVLAPAGLVEATDRLAHKILQEGGPGNVVVGRDSRGLASAPTEFTESRRALALARALGYSGVRLHVEQFGIFSMLFTDPTRADLEVFVRAHIGPLVDHDARHGTDLVPTALALLENNLSPKAAAVVLGVHPNTVNQRAGRIDRLIRPDWRLQPRAFEILAALKLRALRSPGR